MKKSQVTIPGIYAVKVSGKIVPVRIEEPHAYGGYVGVNLKTGRAVRIRTAAKLRYPMEPNNTGEYRRALFTKVNPRLKGFGTQS